MTKAEKIRDGLARLTRDGAVSVALENGCFYAGNETTECVEQQGADMRALGWSYDDHFDSWWISI